MQGDLLPLFPLNVVLFPGTVLPLHIFEERYKEMIGEAISRHSEFGIVLARDKGIVNVGCTAMVEKVVKRYADGRMDVEVAGRRRFEVLMLNEEKSYLRGPVHFFEDEGPETAPIEMRRRALEAWGGLRELDDATHTKEPSADDPQLSFQIAQAVPDLDFRQTLLNIRSEGERLKYLIGFLADYVPARQYESKMKVLAPRNGHGPRPPAAGDEAS